jgi:Ala-tRNA(Pro) deacylase
MTTLKRCIEFLDNNDIPYAHTRHANAYRARDVAAAEHLPACRLAKTVIFSSDDGYGMAVLPADCLLDLEEVAERLNLRHVRLATELEVANLFPECEVGAMPPLGTLFGLPVYIDSRLAEEDYIAFNAGTHRDAIHMCFSDLLRLTDPRITRFAHVEAPMM